MGISAFGREVGAGRQRDRFIPRFDQYLRPIHSFLQLWLNRNCHTSEGGTLHDKVGPFNNDPFTSFWGASHCSKLLGAAAGANSRTDRQEVWSRFVWADPSDPLHLERGNRWGVQTCSRVG